MNHIYLKNIRCSLQKFKSKKYLIICSIPFAFIAKGFLFASDKPPVQNIVIKSPDETKTVDVVIPDSKNRLAVDSYISQISPSGLATINKKLRFDDMNVGNGGVARGSLISNTAWTQLYAYVGKSIVHGWVLNLETKDHWLIRLVCDDEEIFGSNGILLEDVYIDSAYDLDNVASDGQYSGVGISYGVHDRLIYNGPNNMGLTCSTSVKIFARREAGEALKKFNAGLITISKGL